MNCPYCASTDLKVIDKRDSESERAIRRRRECLKCEKRFTTYERVELVDLMVVKKDRRREQFDRNKLKTGIIKACEKRQISHNQIEAMVDEIEQKVRCLDAAEVSSKRIGQEVVRQLKKIDKVAYIRFASVYYSFPDLDSFEKELSKLTNNKKTGD